jgi:putative PIN family toxin of toxin-antitoxin system
MCQKQLKELEDVLKRPKFKKYISIGEAEEFINYLSLKIIMPAIYEEITDCRDKKDNMILEGAVFGNAKFIITGDEDLLVLNPYRWIRIVTLRTFISEVYDI